MMGVRISRTLSQRSVRSCSSMLAGVASTNDCLMSAPAAKALSFPVSTMHLISGSSSSFSSDDTSSSMSSSLSALRTSGRSSWTVAIGGSRRILIVLTAGVPPCSLAEYLVQLALRRGLALRAEVDVVESLTPAHERRAAARARFPRPAADLHVRPWLLAELRGHHRFHLPESGRDDRPQ